MWPTNAIYWHGYNSYPGEAPVTKNDRRKALLAAVIGSILFLVGFLLHLIAYMNMH